MKDLIILILTFSMAVLSYFLIEKNTTPVKEPQKTSEIAYYLKNDKLEDSVLYIDDKFYDRIDDVLILENPPIGSYSLGNIDHHLPKTMLFEVSKEDKVKRINFDNSY